MPYSDNLYPDDFNFPVPTYYLGAVTPPDADPDEGETFLYAYNPEWTMVLLAACAQLTQYASWLGTHDEKILATQRAVTLQILLQNPVYVGEREIPAPYWDSGSDVDDELPVEDQVWYGEVANPSDPASELTFVENAVIWIISGFIALVLVEALPAGVAAALAFRTLATRFTLAFNRGDIREQFRVIIDANEYTTVDTDGLSAGDIVEINIDGMAEADFHDILIVVSNP